MTSTPTGRLRAWVGEVSGDAAVAELDARWAEFAQMESPVATLFGAFDTGKSSILRRILVDAGQAIPEWLTVSARHETFDDHVVDVSGVSIRDTPGLSPQGADARSLENSRVARESLGLTDVLLVTLNPQLATGERDELLQILADDWPARSVWFLISRADEGGVDPMLDPTGFDAWGERKRAELRESLHLDDDEAIHVIVPDYGQLGAFEPDPEPSTWDLSRAWDGMDHLQTALKELHDGNLAKSREAAKDRYWGRAIEARIEDLRNELADLVTSRDAAVSSLEKRNAFQRRLDTLRESAEVSVEGTVEAAVLRVISNPSIDASTIQNVVDPVLEEWWHDQQTEISRIRQDALKTFDQQRDGRAWATFESLYSTSAQPAADGSPVKQVFTPRFEKLGRKAVEGLKAADAVRTASRKVKKPAEAAAEAAEKAKSGIDMGQFAGIGAAALPFVIELAGVIEDVIQTSVEKANRRARRRQLEEDVTRIAKDAGRKAMKELAIDLDSLGKEIDGQIVGRDEVEALEAAVAGADDLVGRGNTILEQRSNESKQN